MTISTEGGDRLGRPPSSSVAKHFRRGTHRLVTPEETLARVGPHLEALGITRVANVTGLDHVGLPVVAVYRPNARSLAVSQGKGLDLAAAKASGVMEAIESHHAEHLRLSLRLASAAELTREAAVADVSRLPRLSVSGFHPSKAILWCEGVDLMGGGPVWVPYEMVHTNYTLPLPAGSGNFQMSSNGLASGNHWLEAVSHGICEVVERDAMALWDLRGGTGQTLGRVDLGSVDDPFCRQVLDRLLAAGQAVGIWDVTTDVGLAAFACVIADRRGNHLGQFYSSHGSGCHTTREVAMMRALTEAAQTRLTYIAGARDDAHRERFEQARNPDRVAQVLRDIERDPGADAVRFEDVPSRPADTFDDDLAWELERLRAVGIEQVAAVDLGGRVPGVSVARVVIPGLEGLHDAPGYVPGPRAQAQLQEARR